MITTITEWLADTSMCNGINILINLLIAFGTVYLIDYILRSARRIKIIKGYFKKEYNNKIFSIFNIKNNRNIELPIGSLCLCKSDYDTDYITDIVNEIDNNGIFLENVNIITKRYHRVYNSYRKPIHICDIIRLHTLVTPIMPFNSSNATLEISKDVCEELKKVYDAYDNDNYYKYIFITDINNRIICKLSLSNAAIKEMLEHIINDDLVKDKYNK